jgi:hypothetical protein
LYCHIVIVDYQSPVPQETPRIHRIEQDIAREMRAVDVDDVVGVRLELRKDVLREPLDHLNLLRAGELLQVLP